MVFRFFLPLVFLVSFVLFLFSAFSVLFEFEATLFKDKGRQEQNEVGD